jgi:hypothetical protein
LIRYNPGSSHVPEPFVPSADFPGAVVLLVAGGGAREWAARTAVDLAAAWAHSGRRVVLADLHLEDPFLHETVGEENLEGVADVFLYGASLARSARPLHGRGFHLVTAGTYTDETGEVYAHPRWKKLIAGFRGAQASLVLFAPAEPETVRVLGEHADDVLFLDSPVELAEAVPLHARTHPALLPPVPAPAAAVPAEPPAPVEIELPTAGDVVLPPPPEPRRKRRIRAGIPPFLWVLLVLGGLLLTGLLVASERPELLGPLQGRLGVAGEEREHAPATPISVRRATPLGDTLSYSIQIKAYNSLRAARQQLGMEERRHRDVPFVISPELVSGILYYKIYAGMTADTAEAVRLRQRLVASGSLDESDALGSWPLIHATLLTFLLREEVDRELAVARADSLSERGIPAYTVRLPFSDGSSRWRVYGGAFVDTLRSEGMRQLMRDSGVPGQLVVRLGTLEEDG